MTWSTDAGFDTEGCMGARTPAVVASVAPLAAVAGEDESWDKAGTTDPSSRKSGKVLVLIMRIETSTNLG
jgi:hypothetical protein